jgi:hypothetical protein
VGCGSRGWEEMQGHVGRLRGASAVRSRPWPPHSKALPSSQKPQLKSWGTIREHQEPDCSFRFAVSDSIRFHTSRAVLPVPDRVFVGGVHPILDAILLTNRCPRHDDGPQVRLRSTRGCCRRRSLAAHLSGESMTSKAPFCVSSIAVFCPVETQTCRPPRAAPGAI